MVREPSNHAVGYPTMSTIELGVDTFDCAIPTRLGRHGVALVPDPEARWRLDLTKGRYSHAPEPILEGCPCPACAGGHSRGYLRYLVRQRELTGLRLVTLHNLAYVSRLMERLRRALARPDLVELQGAGDRVGGAAAQGTLVVDRRTAAAQVDLGWEWPEPRQRRRVELVALIREIRHPSVPAGVPGLQGSGFAG